ncbi:hypothetical protein EV193_11954 [Herbihabitans rhizosphaerae]|uniref:Uncharacterized protein n=1 Tax=Herbihabitans rhizosphaerae TaxID=1872711 RepID=A0A4V2ER93_9PSEU|nr:hypothetical protein [Herbihabitans rhizosphaerae]RZS29651.1 hypothetical protein EV193_11954 [Herbihabitans rhizosphaerae]
MASLVRRLFGKLTHGLPDSFTGELSPEENVVAVGDLRGGGHLVATTRGLWISDGTDARRLDWHLISKAAWDDGSLTVVEARESGTAGAAVLLEDQAPQRFRLSTPRKVPQVVHQRVTGSIKSSHHRDLPGGGAWFVQRSVPGQDGVVLQVRPDPGTDEGPLRSLAAEVAEAMRLARERAQQ